MYKMPLNRNFIHRNFIEIIFKNVIQINPTVSKNFSKIRRSIFTKFLHSTYYYYKKIYNKLIYSWEINRVVERNLDF